MNDNGNPTAQGQSAGTESQNNEGQNVSPGVQARIDELTARLRETERQAKEKDDQLMAALQAMAVAQPVYQAPQAPPVEIDPEEKRRLDAILGPQLAALEAQNKRVEAMLSQFQFQQAAQSAPSEVQAEAQKLLGAWKSQGKTGWVPEDALLVAEAIVARKKGQSASGATQQRQEFNQQQQAISQQPVGGAPAPSIRRGVPADIDKRPLAEQIAILSKEIGDLPL